VRETTGATPWHRRAVSHSEHIVSTFDWTQPVVAEKRPEAVCCLVACSRDMFLTKSSCCTVGRRARAQKCVKVEASE
jgi:hypothetical protein